MSPVKLAELSGQDLIPLWWRDVHAETAADVLFFGQATIRQMIRSWRRTAQDYRAAITDLEEKITFLAGKSALDFAKLANQFEDPDFPIIAVDSDTWHEPEPRDVASINREHGATTYNVCGWCKYAGGGLLRYNIKLTTSCDYLIDAGLPDTNQPILPFALAEFREAREHVASAANEVSLQAAARNLRSIRSRFPDIAALADNKPWYRGSTERRFDTPCFLPFASEARLNEIRAGIVARQQDAIARKKHADRVIRRLVQLEKQAEQKPCLPSYRPYNWFNVNDRIAVYVGQWDDRLNPSTFADATVVNGYRHHDGGVSFHYDVRMHTGEYLAGHGGGSGTSRPDVMLDWEFQYLQAHPQFATVWLYNTESVVRCDRQRMLLDLHNPTVANRE